MIGLAQPIADNVVYMLCMGVTCIPPANWNPAVNHAREGVKDGEMFPN